MRHNQSQWLLLSLLALYIVARVLQLFAGRIPSFFIVSFHVIPPALFSLVHLNTPLGFDPQFAPGIQLKRRSNRV